MVDGAAQERLLVVTVPVANLRREPKEARRAHLRDELQETQLLFNETLLYRSEQPGWFSVEAREQLKSTGKGWQGYPGWVRKECVSFVAEAPRYNAVVKRAVARLVAEPTEGAAPVLFLSLGTRLVLVDEPDAQAGLYGKAAIGGTKYAWVRKEDVTTTLQNASISRLRSNIVQTASLFIGVPYLWGGRSMFMADLTETVTGIDCSGLTNLIYRVHNIDIPRDAQDQWLAAHVTSDGPRENSPDESPRPGDLIFVARTTSPDSIDHVMLSMGGEWFIEAAETGSNAREKTFQQKFGLDLARLAKMKFTVQGKRIYFAAIEHFAGSH